MSVKFQMLILYFDCFTFLEDVPITGVPDKLAIDDYGFWFLKLNVEETISVLVLVYVGDMICLTGSRP